ncbi:MAG: hypothetical protein A9Z00_06825 [Thermobacillus sp. ZCTH02-B1]|nr:MAG: hypothetical protein A9Z00_06825 [Thermobacillus sp. ZCTH02-B1]
MRKWRIGLLCALLAFLCVVSADSGRTRDHGRIRDMLESHAEAVREGRNPGQRLSVIWSKTPAGGQVEGIAPMTVTLVKKRDDGLWEAVNDRRQTIWIRVIFPQAAPSLGENRSYVIPGIRSFDEERGQEIYAVEGDLIRPLDVEDP